MGRCLSSDVGPVRPGFVECLPGNIFCGSAVGMDFTDSGIVMRVVLFIAMVVYKIALALLLVLTLFSFWLYYITVIVTIIIIVIIIGLGFSFRVWRSKGLGF